MEYAVRNLYIGAKMNNQPESLLSDNKEWYLAKTMRELRLLSKEQGIGWANHWAKLQFLGPRLCWVKTKSGYYEKPTFTPNPGGVKQKSPSVVKQSLKAKSSVLIISWYFSYFMSVFYCINHELFYLGCQLPDINLRLL